jgi:UDPglucose 6-dehydrogenase
VKVGWIGLGKLGLPCALVLAQHHDVYGYDVSERPWRIILGQEPPMQEELLEELIHSTVINACISISDVVRCSDVIFVAVQTPHSPEFGGESPKPPDEWADFEYSFLVQACQDVARAAQGMQKSVILVVVSTVLPGTTDRLIKPVLNHWVDLVYSPQFIAMGTTIHDFTDPEFVLCGTESVAAAAKLETVFMPVHGLPLCRCSIATAESIKVFYNTFISMKIVWANHVMEMCHNIGADCDDVVNVLSLATDRVISTAYMHGGMGDGGACHPRDLIAMGWLEQEQDVSYPLFGSLACAREDQTYWLAGLVREYAVSTGYRVTILGMAYKPGSDLMAGSPALLLRHYLEDLHPHQYDPHTGGSYGWVPEGDDDNPRVCVIATKHPEFAEYQFSSGSVVVDPFGYIPDQEGVAVIRVGRQP